MLGKNVGAGAGREHGAETRQEAAPRMGKE